MNMPKILADSSVPLFAIGTESPLREPSRAALRSLAAAGAPLYASVEMVQEVVHHRLRMTGDRQRAVAEANQISRSVDLLAFDETVLSRALSLISSSPTIRDRLDPPDRLNPFDRLGL
jgi:predicted nucleic acid-binding protein